MTGPKASLSNPAFEEFFRGAYRPLVRDVIFAGASPDEAEDAVSNAMAVVLRKWNVIGNPHAYARQAAMRSFIKSKTRGSQRIVDRLVQWGDARPEHGPDPGLMIWEQQEWVMMLLKTLPPAQQEVVACMVDMFSQQEIALLLGKTEAAVRQNLCAARKRLKSYLAETGGAEAHRAHNREEER